MTSLGLHSAVFLQTSPGPVLLSLTWRSKDVQVQSREFVCLTFPKDNQVFILPQPDQHKHSCVTALKYQVSMFAADPRQETTKYINCERRLFSPGVRLLFGGDL